MSQSFLAAAAARAFDAAAAARPLPTDDALAALELLGPVCQLGAGDGVWAYGLRVRGLVDCVCYDAAPQMHSYTHVLSGGHAAASQHTDRTLLLVRGAQQLDDSAALEAFSRAGGSLVAHVGLLPVGKDAATCSGSGSGSASAGSGESGHDSFARELVQAFERQLTVILPGPLGDRLTVWKKKAPPAPAGQTECGVLDVRLELVDLEAPDWAEAPKPAGMAHGNGPAMSVVDSGRTIKPTMDRAAFEASLPDDF